MERKTSFANTLVAKTVSRRIIKSGRKRIQALLFGYEHSSRDAKNVCRHIMCCDKELTNVMRITKLVSRLFADSLVAYSRAQWSRLLLAGATHRRQPSVHVPSTRIASYKASGGRSISPGHSIVPR